MAVLQGQVAGWRTANFERVYDLPERVIPADVLAKPTPPMDEAQRQLLLQAAQSLGIGTMADLASFYRIKQQPARRVAELVEAGDLVQVSVEGWAQPAFMPPGVHSQGPKRSQATFLSPFDLLIYDRERTRRLFGFNYQIETYTPEAKRQYGYFVLPVLVGDELAGRLDLKADRSTSTLRVLAAHIEAGSNAGALIEPVTAELRSMASWLGLDRVGVADRGEFAPALRGAL